MGNSTAELEANLIGPFRDGLRALGYDEGRNVQIEYRWADGRLRPVPGWSPNCLHQGRSDRRPPAPRPRWRLSAPPRRSPLVMIAVGDPVGTGIVPSLARPGGNITGLSSIAPDLEGKRLELLREIVPKLSHVARVLEPGECVSCRAP